LPRPTPDPSADVDCFDPAHLADLDRAAHVAGEMVSEAYGLDLGDFRQWPVDLRHWPQLTDEERTGGDALAQLFRYARQGPVLKAGRADFWRICLYDPAILAAVGRESLGLHPLLCYVLTHEFVHVARFIRFMELFGLDRGRREAEEALVHAETERLLAGLSIPGLDKVRHLYRHRSIPLDGDPAARPGGPGPARP
jgi:hypothetical protein